MKRQGFNFSKLNLSDVDSKEEKYFEWWLDELVKNGYVKSYNRCNSFQLIPKAYIPVLKRKPLKSEPNRLVLEAQHFLHPLSYTPDYDIYWEEKAIGLFVFSIDELFVSEKTQPYFLGQKTDLGLYSCVDVKPIFFRTQNSSSITFPLKKKMMWNKFGVYVNKTIPIGKEELFCKTFTPERYFLQDLKPKNRSLGKKFKTNKKTKITTWSSGWEPITLKQFLK